MSRLRIPHLLAGLAVAAALVLGAVCDWGHLLAIIATLGPGDALLGTLGIVLAAMTGAAGVLIAVDARTDIVAARAWDDVHAETVVIATPAETAPIDRGDVLYVAGPQDEGLRRILLAHRFMVPVRPPNDFGSTVPEHGDARAVPAGASSTDRTVSASDSLGESLTAPAAALRKLGPELISSNARRAWRSVQNYAVRKTPAAKRIANAGRRGEWSVFAIAAASRVPGSHVGYSEIVLADRSGRDENPAPSDIAPEPQAKVQPCCRGPPRATFRRPVPDGPAHPGKPFRETNRWRAKPPADVMIDDLGDRVPVCEAELAVLEAYLEDVLDDVLGSSKPAIKPT